MSEILEIYDELHARGLIREAVVGLITHSKIIKDFVSLVGSTAENGAGNDIDIVIRSKEDRHIGTRILKLFPEELQDKVHLIWESESPGVPHDTYIPLFDLCMHPADHTMVEMQSGKFTPGRRFLPPKTTVQTFFEVEQMEEFLEKSKVNARAIEQKFDGFRAITHRNGDVVKIYSGQARDITRSFPSIASQAKKLTSKNFIIDGELVLYDDNGIPQGRADLIKFIIGKERPSDKNIKYHVFDILYLR